MENALSNLVTNRSDMAMRMQISSGSLKKQINQHKVQTVAFGRMMKNSSIDGTGMLVDIYA